MKQNYLLGLAILLLFCMGNSAKAQDYSAQLPIVAWHSIPEDQLTLERFQELRDAGFTMSLHWYSKKGVQKAADLAHKVGMQLIMTCPELKTKPEETVREFKDHPGIAGYLLKDEPSATEFPELGEWARRIQSVDNKKFCYLNLFPDWGEYERLGTKDYREHVSRFIKEVGLPLISFDNYPVKKEGLSRRWYVNLEVIADEARKANLPFWAFALATQHGSYPIPTREALRLQLYSNLVYGAQVLQYFTYWTPKGDSKYDFQYGPIGLDNKRTPIYDLIKEMNAEIYKIAGVFKGCKVLDVRHTGETIPVGTRRLNELPTGVNVLDTNGAGAIVSLLENKGHRFLAIVNRSYTDSMYVNFSADKGVKRILKDGSVVDASLYSPRMLVTPGDILIYMLK